MSDITLLSIRLTLLVAIDEATTRKRQLQHITFGSHHPL